MKLTLETKTISMIRTILPLFLLLGSCGIIEIKDIPTYSRLLILGAPDIEISNEYYLDMTSSFAKVKLGRSSVAILSLVSIDDGIYTWIGEDDTRIYTANGKIVESLGLDFDVSYKSNWDYPFNLSYYKTNSHIKLENPSAFIYQQSTLKYSHEEIISLEKDYQTKVFIEDFDTARYKWSGQNIYWLSERGRVMKSIQKIHPNLAEIEITFYYK